MSPLLWAPRAPSRGGAPGDTTGCQVHPIHTPALSSCTFLQSLGLSQCPSRYHGSGHSSCSRVPCCVQACAAQRSVPSSRLLSWAAAFYPWHRRGTCQGLLSFSRNVGLERFSHLTRRCVAFASRIHPRGHMNTQDSGKMPTPISTAEHKHSQGLWEKVSDGRGAMEGPGSKEIQQPPAGQPTSLPLCSPCMSARG